QCFFPRLSDLELNTTSTRHRPDPRFSNRPISVLLYFIRSESIVEGIKVFDFKCFNYQSSCLTLLLLSYCSTSSFSKPSSRREWLQPQLSSLGQFQQHLYSSI